uniref:EpsI family protein n=1 Tax=Geobacter metallireducens TaxID=28232 RepID=A0A831UCP4_GEOME
MNRRLVAAAVILALFTVYLKTNSFQQKVPLKRNFTEFPLRHGSWVGESYGLDDRVTGMLKMDEYLNRQYVNGDHQVGIYIGYYGTQREGGQIHSPQICLPAAGWVKVSETTDTVTVDRLGPVRYVKALYQKGSEKEIFAYWYRMKDTNITSEYELRIYRFLNALRYGRNDAAFIRISVPVRNDVDSANLAAQGFMRDFLPLLADYLPD